MEWWTDGVMGWSGAGVVESCKLRVAGCRLQVPLGRGLVDCRIEGLMVWNVGAGRWWVEVSWTWLVCSCVRETFRWVWVEVGREKKIFPLINRGKSWGKLCWRKVVQRQGVMDFDNDNAVKNRGDFGVKIF